MNRPLPRGWSKTLGELLAEKCEGVSAQEIEWAKTFERQQLRSWARFPRPGEVYELVEDAEIAFVTHWGAPFTGGGKGMLRKGTRVRIMSGADDPEPIGVYAEPLEKARIEAELVPEKDRCADEYAGFSLTIDTGPLNRLFRLVSADGS